MDLQTLHARLGQLLAAGFPPTLPMTALGDGKLWEVAEVLPVMDDFASRQPAGGYVAAKGPAVAPVTVDEDSSQLTLRPAADTPVPASAQPFCPGCGASFDDTSCTAHREDLALAGERSVSIIVPVHRCSKCTLQWTDYQTEAIREYAATDPAAAGVVGDTPVAEVHVHAGAPAEFFWRELDEPLQPGVYPLFLKFWTPEMFKRLRELASELDTPPPPSA